MKGEKGGAEVLVTTEKDLVRLEGFSQEKIPLWAIGVRHKFAEGEEKKFEEFFWENLGMGQTN